MTTVLLGLLERLESIEKEHDGLGEINVREQMQAHLFRGYLRPERGFAASGRYGLDPLANERVREALDEFCAHAPAAALRDGLATFRQRLAAFQNSAVRTSAGSDFNDFFGVIDPLSFDENGYEITRAPATERENKARPRERENKARRLWRFNRPGTIADLLTALNEYGVWLWNTTGSDEEPCLQTVPAMDSKIQIRDEYELMNPDGAMAAADCQFIALLEAVPSDLGPIADAFNDSLNSSGCTAISEGSDYDW